MPHEFFSKNETAIKVEDSRYSLSAGIVKFTGRFARSGYGEYPNS